MSEVFVFDKVLGSKPSDDGKHILLLVTLPTGEQAEIAFAADAVPELISGAADAHAKAGASHGSIPAYEVTWFSFGEEIGGNIDTLSLTIGGGGRIHFALPAGMLSNMLGVLKGMAGEADKPTGQPN